MNDAPKKYYIIKTQTPFSILLFMVIVAIPLYFYYDIHPDYGIYKPVEGQINSAIKKLLDIGILIAIFFIAHYLSTKLSHRYLRVYFDAETITLERLARDKKTICDFESHHISRAKRFSDFNIGTARTFKLTFPDKQEIKIFAFDQRGKNHDLARLIRDFKAFLRTANYADRPIKYYDFYRSIWGKLGLLLALGLLCSGLYALIKLIFLNTSMFHPSQFFSPSFLVFIAGDYIWGYFERVKSG